MTTSFNGRENRRLRAAQLIMENYSNGEWFTVHDIMDLWILKWKRALTNKELCKTLPIFDLEYTFMPGHNYKYYRYVPKYDEDGNLIPLYTRRDRDEMSNDDNIDSEDAER